MEEKKNNLKESILAEIQKAGLSPKARWRFVLDHILLWVPAVTAVVFGAIAFSAILFELSNAGWQFHRQTHPTLFAFLRDIFPVFWLVLAAVFGYLAITQIRRTFKGYKYNLAVVILGSILASAVFGAVAYSQGVGAVAERKIGPRIPFHTPIEDLQETIWSRPEEGRLAGEITSLGEEEILLDDFDENIWRVDVTQVPRPAFALLDEGVEARILGYLDEEGEMKFFACDILPWNIRGLPSRPPEVGRLGAAVIEARNESERNLLPKRSKECSYILLKTINKKPNAKN